MTLFNKVTSLNRAVVVLFPLSVILMEVMWVYPWLTLIGRWLAPAQERHPLSLISLIFLLGTAFLVTRYSISKQWSLEMMKGSVLTSAAVALLVILRIEYPAGSSLLDPRWFIRVAQLLVGSFTHPHPIAVALAGGVYAWWRGIGLGRSSLYSEDIYRSFMIGLLALVVLVLAWGTSAIGSLVSTTGLYVAGFFFFGLSALSLAKYQEMLQRGEEKERNTVVSSRWLTIIAMVIGAIVLVGLGVASIFSTDLPSVLRQIFNLASLVLFKLIYYVSTVAITIMGFLIAVIFYIFQLIMNLLGGRRVVGPEPSENMTGLEPLPQGVTPDFFPIVETITKWVLLGLIIAGVVFLLARAIMRRSPSRAKGDVEEIHESLWSWRGFLADLRLVFILLWQLFKGKVKGVVPQLAVLSRRRGADIQGGLSIREIYRRLLRQAADLGIARRHYETPYEYGQRLERAVPEGSIPLSELTDLYVGARYSDVETEARQVNRANDLWRAVQALIQGRMPG